MPFPTPDGPVDLEPWLDSVGNVFVVITGHDSGLTSYGVQVGDQQWFVKHAPPAMRFQTEGAVRVHAAVQHPAIIPLLAAFETTTGHAVVYPWLPGENLYDPFVPGTLPREHEGSALARFRGLTDAQSLAAYDTLLDAHLAVTAAGLVAVDLYDGCLLYDFDEHVLRLVDLDMYRPPYVLDVDRQYGSGRLSPAEEYRRGSEIGEPTTVYTLARLALDLGCVRHTPLIDVVVRATRAMPRGRHQTVAEYVAAWREIVARDSTD